LSEAFVDKSDLEIVEHIARSREKILTEVSKVIVGQEKVLDELLIALFSQGHCLFVGVPGLAKTLLVNTLARVLDLEFKRVQFTPDLMPSDITGTDILEEDPVTKQRTFKFIKGPIFCNILLADEINRTPPKTQAALLQAMQEYKVSAGGTTYPLSLPFFVLATQNPIEQEGTYPLPEAELDRFMLNIYVHYPQLEEEMQIVKRTTSDLDPQVEVVLNAAEILALQRMVRRVPCSDYVISYAVRLVRNSRPTEPTAFDFIKNWVDWGAGPRASQYLILGGKARAILRGRYAVSTEDIRAIAPSVLRHRIVTNFKAEAEGISSLDIIQKLIEETPETLS
jgi:MoxR-like ATPase